MKGSINITYNSPESTIDAKRIVVQPELPSQSRSVCDKENFNAEDFNKVNTITSYNKNDLGLKNVSSAKSNGQTYKTFTREVAGVQSINGSRSFAQEPKSIVELDTRKKIFDEKSVTTRHSG